jgi:hypothetical protein
MVDKWWCNGVGGGGTLAGKGMVRKWNERQGGKRRKNISV